ncbi:SPOR domain-containing protein [uncultured Bacteroides sp.]|uniref:SPOR domain-containing protein n=1 Tax=uncultured Bacteroides sp. TaxID=162156 RepID=UPI002AAAC8E3|nr:SPOR domain-containing protein [uncultured Bacteroides sp.]
MKTYSFYLSFLFLIFFVSGLEAQNIVKSLERDVLGQGKVRIHEDPRIESLLGQEYISDSLAIGNQQYIKLAGYRVQIYAGNNSRTARSEAQAIGAKVKDYFPDWKVYTTFTSPRWLCRIGDFRSIEEADAAMRKLKETGVFKEVSIVKEQINISL